jgi:hypothetical protein
MKARALPLLVAAATMVVPFGNAFAAAAVNAASPTAPASHGNPRSGATPAAAKKDPRLSEMFKGAEGGTEPSFRRHVVPLMSRLGCSGRECHGSFQGRGGFQLSLFGYDFDNDHGQMTTADNGDEGEVRVNLKSPPESLLLRKGAALMSHKGKERFAKGSWEYNLLLRWIGGGARIDVAETGEFDRLEVLPKEIVFRKPGDAAQLRVLAHWKDGTVEDVTEITRFRSNDESVAAVSETGRVTSSGKGDSHVVAFYDNGVVPVAVMLPASAPASYPKVVAAKNKVDELVNAKLRKAGIIPSPLCSDADFLRRASLDVTGTLPTPREVEAFLADKTADKRDRKIDELLERPGYAAWWTTKLCDFTGNNPAVLRGNNLAANVGQVNLGPQLSRQWFDWVYARISQNKPYDELAAGIVLGSMRARPDQPYDEYVVEMSSYFRKDGADFGNRETMPWFWARQNVQKPEDKALAFAHTFLGVRIECAQCHKHPFDQWTKQDFAQFQAFFTGIAFKQGDEKADKSKRVLGAMAAANAEGKTKETPTAAPRADEAEVTYAGLRDKIRAEATAKIDAQYRERDLKNAREERERRLGELQKKIDAPEGLSEEELSGLVGEALRLKEAPVVPLPLTTAEQTRRTADLRVAYQRAEETIVRDRLGRGEGLAWADLSASAPKTAKPAKAPAPQAQVRGSSRVMTPKLLGGEAVMLETFQDVRKPLMDWLRDPENPYFAKAWVNRVWASYFGRGLVEPADDLNLANAPSNAELFDYLAAAFVGSGFDMKWLHREILRSHAYQRSWQTNPTNKTDEKNFARALVRRLPAEVVYDAMMMATETRERMEAYPGDVAGRAIGAGGTTTYVSQKAAKAPNLYALNIFGKPARQTNCDCERVTDPTLLQTIYTRNDPSLLGRIEDKNGTAWIEEAFGLKPGQRSQPAELKEKARTTVDAVVREVFLRTLSRPPSGSELETACSDVLSHDSPVVGARELLWTMLNTREFLVNH